MRYSRVLTSLLGIAVFFWAIHVYWPAGSVEGDDRDGNGVWDDIDARIAARTTIEPLKRAVEQEARITQRILLSPEKARELVSELDKAMNCIAAIQAEYKQDIFGPVQTRDLFITTRARERAWIKFNVGLSGGIYPAIEARRSACEF